jgi:predicted transcriptional regulator
VNDRLTKDEFDALAQISQTKKRERPSACVARNAKRLSGLKYITHGRDGQFALTEKGQQTLFVKRCIDGLQAVSTDALAKLDTGVATFLSKKGLVTPRASNEGFDITQRGREMLADIESQQGGKA